jgi:hypothetical protein
MTSITTGGAGTGGVQHYQVAAVAHQPWDIIMFIFFTDRQ